jgi:hypothetical protein
LTTCPECRQQVPERPFCVRCGARLAVGDGSGRGFAAAPHEHRLLPAIVSSLFPHLPRADMRHYRWAMGVGTAIVLGLGIAGLFPVALAGAALLVPVLAALYLHDVNVYEEEPLLVVGFTLAWGAIAGVGIALLAHALEPSSLNQLASGHHASALITIVLLPTLELVLAVAGPALILLPHRRYNDVLDGVTFGAATAAALSATEVIVNGYKLFEHGLAPGGAVLPWILRLLTIRLALPILAMAATGAACGALWLRVRAPRGDRGALGPLGHPLVALTLRAGLLMLAAAGQRWLPVGAWLAMLLVLDGIALVWLRLMLQLGLREEAAEFAIGPDIQCPNCGAQTPHHSYCAECGVSLRALPKRREAAAPPTAAPPHASRSPVVTRGRVQAFAVFVAALVVATGVIGAIAPRKLQARCSATSPCGAPPSLAAPLRSESVWRSSEFGFALEYSPQQWKIGQQGAAGVELRSLVAPVDLVVEGGNAAPGAQLVAARLSQLRSNVLGLTRDTSSADTILGPEVGYHYGVGGAYVGAVDSPQGVTDQVLATIQAAVSGPLGIVVTTLTNETRAGVRRQVYGLVDAVVNTITWPGES